MVNYKKSKKKILSDNTFLFLQVFQMGALQLEKKFKIKSYFEKTGNRLSKEGKIYRFKNYNERYFEFIDSADKAYFLGLLSADGNVSPRLTAARIALKETDSDILEKFREHLGDEAPKLRTKYSKHNGVLSAPQKNLCLSRINLVQDLIRHGLTPNKSKTLEIKCDLKEYKKDFLRGVWDGDGSVGVRRFKVCTASIKFSIQLQKWIEEISGFNLPIKEEKNKSGSILYVISGYIQDAPAIHAIYGNTDLALKRKLNSYRTYWEPRR
jgi:uncharacterized protein YaaR (DUF327 family)